MARLSKVPPLAALALLVLIGGLAWGSTGSTGGEGLNGWQLFLLLFNGFSALGVTLIGILIRRIFTGLDSATKAAQSEAKEAKDAANSADARAQALEVALATISAQCPGNHNRIDEGMAKIERAIERLADKQEQAATRLHERLDEQQQQLARHGEALVSLGKGAIRGGVN